MNKEDIKKWVNENQGDLIRYISIDEWRIDTIILDSEENNKNEHYVTGGKCHAQFEYRQATITLFADNIHTLRQLQEVYVHELCHIATASFKFYHNYLFDSELVSTWQKEKLSPIYRAVSELLAVQMQRAVSGFFYGYIDDRKVSKEDLERKVEDLCYANEHMKEHKPRILLKDVKTQASKDLNLEEALWDKKKDDEDFWYEKWRKSRELTRTEKEPEKKIVFLNEPQKTGMKNIILPDNFEDEEDE